MKNSILEKARWLREVALATSKNNGARVAREWLKYAAMFVMLFTIGSGNVWGASTETFTTTSSGGFSDNSKTIAPITVTMRDGTSNKTSWQTAHVRVYSGGGVTISSSGGNITKIEFTCTANKGSNNGPDKQKLASGSSGTYSTTNGSAVGVWTYASGATNIEFNATAQIRFTQITVTYESGCNGTQLETPVVTATPSDRQVILSWPDVSNASSYQLKWNGGDWASATSPVTKTSLTNGTAYTYQVKAIGNGSTYCDGDASEEASVTPNVFRTITYYDKDGQHTTSLADGTNIADALNALYGVSDPTSCDAVNYGYFVGWKVGEISGTASSVTLLDDEVVNASSPSNNYYAVWSDTDPASAGVWTKVGAGELAVGDKVVFVYAGATNKEMTGVASNLGTATSITTIPDDITGVYVLTVEAGNGGSGYSFKNGSNYLSYSGSSNNLYTSTEKNNNSSWTISTSTDGNYKFANVGTTSRILQYNSGNPRWACYTSSQSAFQIYKQSAGGDAEYITTCCTALGSINGSINLSQLATPDPTKLKASWAMNAVTGIASYTLEVYGSSDNLVKTINNYTSGSEITGLTPCTGYYVKLYTVSSGGEYCDGGLIGTSGSCTTNGYTLKVNKSNVSLNSGSEPTNICGDVSATYAASAGYTLPTSISVTNAGAENTGWTWNSSTGVLTINKASVTGNVTVTITGTAQSNFPNNKTIFIQAHSTSAWTGGGCVMAWFHSYGGSETAQPTYWLFDAGGPDEGKKLFAAIVPTTGDLPYLDIQRFAANCSDWWNKNGGCSYSDAAGSNTIRSEGSGNDQVYWNASGVTLSLYGDPNSWASSLGTFADQGAGIWTATYNNYAPANAAGETQNFKISTNYNGWIGNTGSNNNATLDDMHVGSTYNITATLDVKDHSLTMSKTFVKGTVHFDLQGHGSTISDLTNVAAGSKISAPSPAPSATGWDFGGWYKEAGCTNAWNFVSDEVTETMTLYAKWTEKPKYIITLNAGNGTVSEAGWEKDGDVWKQQQSNGDASITYPSASSNCAGWEFVGWATSAANNVSSDPTSKAAGATLVPTGDVTYYAVYRQNSTGGTTYNKITDIGDLTTGDYLFVSTANYAMKNEVSSGRMTEASGYSATSSSFTTSYADRIWTIVKFGSQVAIRNGSNFLGIDGDNNISLSTTPQFFTYTYNTTNERWEFTSVTNPSYQLIYGGSPNYFRMGTAQGSYAIYLYKQGAGLTGNYYTNPTCSDLSITGVADPAAGGSVTLSATSAKSGEKVYAYYTENPAYRFKSWSVSGTGASISSTTAKFTEITVGSADVTLTANFAARVMYSVTWKANGEELKGVDLGSASTSVETGEKIINLPPNPSSCDGTSTAFVGWIAESEIWSGKTDDVSAKHIYTAASEIPAVTGAVTYHAVWAKKTGGSGNETLTCSKGTVVSNTMTFSTTNYTIIHKKNDSGVTMAAYSPWRVYEKNTVEISGSMTITGLDIVHSETYYGVLQSNKGTLTLANSSGGTTTVRGIDATEVIITNKSGAPQSQWTSIKIYYDNSTYNQYLVKCCNTPTLTFAASPYAVLREDLGGASTTTWAEVDVTFTSNSTGTISAAQYSNATVTNGTAYQLAASKWQEYETTGGTLCGAAHAYFEVLTQPSGETPGTGKFHVKTSSGQTGQGTYRIAITQEGTDESHGNYCETTVYGFVDVTLRDKFVDNVNGNGTVTRDGHGAQLATPTLSEFGTQEEDACHSERRKLKGWIKETDLKAQYETGSSTRVQTVDGLCETCADGTDQTSLIVAPGTNVTMSGATWYAVWAYER